MISTITFKHGKTRCASAPGVFCRFMGTMAFGTYPFCMLFADAPLFSNTPDGSLQRCPACLKEFK